MSVILSIAEKMCIRDRRVTSFASSVGWSGLGSGVGVMLLSLSLPQAASMVKQPNAVVNIFCLLYTSRCV